ncbi:amino acid ABC transporter permease [Nocardioides sp.]|uniref:amino acid ABC transporter permease n=1 Tax=Nocardioides sp. TaxID=35761 RepID=UPI0039E665DA
MTSVLYDVPGPRARVRNLVLNIVGVVILLAIAWFVYAKFDETGQWAGEKWKPLFEWGTWDNFVIPGLLGTLKAFVAGAVLSIAFGLVFGVGRMSGNRWVSWASVAVIEFFRAIPLLLLMLFIYALWPSLGLDANPFVAVVLGLMLYNGSVIAEIVRAGVNSLPSGQREAGLAVGLTQGQTMRLVLLPQALRAMLPAIVAQLVVVLKDTALGYIIGYVELLNQLNKLGSQGARNMVPAAIVIAAVYIILNNLLSFVADQLEKRTRKTVSAIPLEVQAAADAETTAQTTNTF